MYFFFTLNTISDYSVELNHSVHEHDKLKFPVPGELTIIKRACVNMANLNWELWCNGKLLKWELLNVFTVATDIYYQQWFIII